MVELLCVQARELALLNQRGCSARLLCFDLVHLRMLAAYQPFCGGLLHPPTSPLQVHVSQSNCHTGSFSETDQSINTHSRLSSTRSHLFLIDTLSTKRTSSKCSLTSADSFFFFLILNLSIYTYKAILFPCPPTFPTCPTTFSLFFFSQSRIPLVSNQSQVSGDSSRNQPIWISTPEYRSLSVCSRLRMLQSLRIARNTLGNNITLSLLMLSIMSMPLSIVRIIL